MDRAGSSSLKDPELSVVIPTLNEAAVIAACLGSVGSEALVEVVVSDGGSIDATLSEVRRVLPDARIVTGERGRGGQLNRGAAAARGRNLVFLHADCRLPGGWEAAVRAALEDPDVALGCFRLHTEPPADLAQTPVRRAWYRLLDIRALGFGLPYGDQAMFLRRETFARLAGFADIPLMEDVDLARRARRLGRLERVPLAVRTTARRFARAPVRSRLCTATFPLLFRLGVSPRRLAAWYGNPR